MNKCHLAAGDKFLQIVHVLVVDEWILLFNVKSAAKSLTCYRTFKTSGRISRLSSADESRLQLYNRVTLHCPVNCYDFIKPSNFFEDLDIE